MGKKSRRTKTSAPVDTQVDPERLEDTMEDDDDDADVPGLPLAEGSSSYDQIAAVLTGSDDAEIALVLGQAPISCALHVSPRTIKDAWRCRPAPNLISQRCTPVVSLRQAVRLEATAPTVALLSA